MGRAGSAGGAHPAAAAAAAAIALFVVAIGDEPAAAASPPPPNCTKQCHAEKPTAHGSSCPEGKCLGDSCTVRCDDGYDGGSDSYSCDASGSWTGGSLTCKPKVCTGEVSLGPHIESCGSGTYTGPPCTARCMTNYVTKGGVTTYTCDKTGRWSGGSLTCEGKSCGTTPAGEHFPASPEIRFPNSWTGKCDIGYSENGTNAGAYSREFECKGIDGFQPTQPLPCIPIACGDIAQQISGSHDDKCSGDKAFGDPACEAQCSSGYTAKGDKVSITCTTTVASSGSREIAFHGSLQCNKVSCSSSTWKNRPTNANFSVGCASALFEDDSCMATCLDGFTRGEHAIDECHTQAGTDCEGCKDSECCKLYYVENNGKKYNCNWSEGVCLKSASSCVEYSTLRAKEAYSCQADARKSTGVWLPENQAKDLQCQAVDCGDFDAVMPEHITKPHEACVSANNNPENSDPHYFGDTCTVQCLNGWYPRTETTYMCQPDPMRPRSGTGKWISTTNDLDCREGKLNPPSSLLMNNETRVKTPRDEWISSINAYGGPGHAGGFYGWELGDDLGETYSFKIQAFDDHGQPRDYSTLQSVDWLTVQIDRVASDVLPLDDQKLQPPERTSAYPVTLGPGSSKRRMKGLAPIAGIDGFWEVNHKFTEHGVFAISVYICQSQMECLSSNSSFQVKDSGVPTVSVYSDSVYTICPQGTNSAANDPGRQGVLQYKTAGNGLSSCVAKVGYFSPAGPGSIAEKCKDGFNCDIQGMYWPVAKPGYWVDVQSSGQRIVTCDRTPGICPGSTLYGIPGGTWSEHGCWRTNNNATQFTDFSGDYIDLKIKLQIQEDVAGGSDCFMTKKYIQKSGVCTHTADANCQFQLIGNEEGKECFGIIGSRCCAGAKSGLEGGCSVCCDVNSRGGPEQDSCDRKAYHNDGSNICVPCPPNNISKAVIIFAVLFLAALYRPIMYCVNLAQYASTAQGPMLSVLNFFQSSDLFNHGLKLNWPLEFKTFCTRWAALLNFNVTAVLHRLNYYGEQLVHHLPSWMRLHIQLTFPSPDCAFSLSYSTKWYMAMFSPIAFAILIFCSEPLLFIIKPIFQPFFYLLMKLLRLLHQAFCCRCRTNERETHGDEELIKMDQSEWPWFFWKSSEEENYKSDAGTLILCHDIDSSYKKLPTISGRGNLHFLRLKNWPTVKAFDDRDEIYRGFQKACTKTKRLFTMYLMVGYLFLAGTALEPLACVTQPNGKQYIAKNAETPCDWCDKDYATLASWAYVCFSLYGLGIPLLFLFILKSNQDRLLSHGFGKSFGFLSTKMRTEFYAWEVLISFRKLGHVCCTHFSVGYEFQFAMFNLFVTWVALSLQLVYKPFAHWDANLAETLTLTATFLVLLLGIAHATDDFMVPNQQFIRSTEDSGNIVVSLLDKSIYTLMGLGVGTSLLILVRRLNGARFNAAHHKQIREAANENSTQHIPDSVRSLLHKRKTELTKLWAAGLGNNEKPDVQSFESVLKDAEKFRNERLFKFTSAKHISKRNDEWDSFFPKEHRPMMMAWAAHQEAQLHSDSILSLSGDPDEQAAQKRRIDAAKTNLEQMKLFMREVNELEDLQNYYFCNCGGCVNSAVKCCRCCKCCKTSKCCKRFFHWWLCTDQYRNGWDPDELQQQSTLETKIHEDVLPFDRYGQDIVTRDGTTYKNKDGEMIPDRDLHEDRNEQIRRMIANMPVYNRPSSDGYDLQGGFSIEEDERLENLIERFKEKKREAETRLMPTWDEVTSLRLPPRILRTLRLFEQWFVTTFLSDIVLVHTNCAVGSKEASVRVVEKQEVETELSEREARAYEAKRKEVEAISGRGQDIDMAADSSVARVTFSRAERAVIDQRAVEEIIPGARGIRKRTDGLTKETKLFRVDYEWWYVTVDEFGEKQKVFFSQENSKVLTERMINLEKYPWSSSQNLVTWFGMADGLRNARVRTPEITRGTLSSVDKEINLSYAVDVQLQETGLLDGRNETEQHGTRLEKCYDSLRCCRVCGGAKIRCVIVGLGHFLSNIIPYTLAVWTRIGRGFPTAEGDTPKSNNYKVYIRSHYLFTPSDKSFFFLIATWMVTFFFTVRYSKKVEEVLEICEDSSCAVRRPDYDKSRSCDALSAQVMADQARELLFGWYIFWFLVFPVLKYAWHRWQQHTRVLQHRHGAPLGASLAARAGSKGRGSEMQERLLLEPEPEEQPLTSYSSNRFEV